MREEVEQKLNFSLKFLQVERSSHSYVKKIAPHREYRNHDLHQCYFGIQYVAQSPQRRKMGLEGKTVLVRPVGSLL